MSEPLHKTIQLWRSSRQAGRDETLWQFLVRTNPWVFAHHPADACFHEHVWTMRGLHFCKGCAMTVAGWLAAAVLQITTGWLTVVLSQWLAVVFVMLLLPAVLTALLGAPRAWKHVSRFLLGVLMASAIWLFVVTEAWWVRVVLVVVYLAVKIPLDRKRRRENQKLLRSHTVSASAAMHRPPRRRR